MSPEGASEGPQRAVQMTVWTLGAWAVPYQVVCQDFCPQAHGTPVPAFLRLLLPWEGAFLCDGNTPTESISISDNISLAPCLITLDSGSSPNLRQKDDLQRA